MMKKATVLFSALFILFVGTQRAEALLTEYFVTEGYACSYCPSPYVYGTASVDVFIDPSVTNWIAWNQYWDGVYGGLQSYGGEDVFYPGWIGTDDSFNLTVTDPSSASMTVKMDYNGGSSASSGPQNVIFGTAAGTPDALRYPINWSTMVNYPQLFDEAGAFNSMFTSAGVYTFDFAFINEACCSNGYGDVYLLVDTVKNLDDVPEPSTLLLVGSGIFGLGLFRRMRGES